MKKFCNHIKLNPLNKYSWFLIAIFVAASYVMDFFSAAKPLQGFYISLPLILVVLFLCQINPSFTSSYKECNWIDILKKNIFSIGYCFVVGGLIGIIANHNNIDLRGWWPLFLYLLYFYGLVFSLVFSAISWVLKYSNHAYNSIFFVTIVFLLASLAVFPRYVKVVFFGEVDVGIVILIGLVIAHLFFTLSLKLLNVSGDHVR